MSVCFSVIICNIDAWKFAQASTAYERLLAQTPHEIIGIHDACSLAEGYCRGMEQASGEILVFSHDDVLFLDTDFASKLETRMETWDVLGFAGTTQLLYPIWFAADWPHLHGAVSNPYSRDPRFLHLSIFGASDWPVVGNIAALDGLCMIARHEVAKAVGFDAHTFDGWHLYDLDFSFAAHLAGYKIGVCCDMPYIHASAGTFLSDDHIRHAERFVRKYPEHIHLEHQPPLAPFGKSGLFSGQQALLASWDESTLRRATLALRYQKTGRREA
jgi:hypothetical protein